MSRWRPSFDCHYAVILNRAYIRACIIEIRRAREGRTYTPSSEAIFLKRLKSDWWKYRWSMQAQEIERLTQQKVFKAIIEPMLDALNVEGKDNASEL